MTGIESCLWGRACLLASPSTTGIQRMAAILGLTSFHRLLLSSPAPSSCLLTSTLLAGSPITVLLLQTFRSKYSRIELFSRETRHPLDHHADTSIEETWRVVWPSDRARCRERARPIPNERSFLPLDSPRPSIESSVRILRLIATCRRVLCSFRTSQMMGSRRFEPCGFIAKVSTALYPFRLPAITLHLRTRARQPLFAFLLFLRCTRVLAGFLDVYVKQRNDTVVSVAKLREEEGISRERRRRKVARRRTARCGAMRYVHTCRHVRDEVFTEIKSK